jgi:hypothetical protein
MTHLNASAIARIGCLAATLCFMPIAEAKKPSNPPGGGGGGVSYRIVKLDDADGTLGGTAFDINNSRLIVGGVVASLSGEEEIALAAYWTVTESGRSISSSVNFLAGGDVALGCNEFGEIVGHGGEAAVYWADTGASAVPLPKLPGEIRGVAESISNDGVICGWSELPADPGGPRNVLAVVWRVTHTPDGPQIWGPLALDANSPDPGIAYFSFALDANDQASGGEITIVGETNEGAVAWDLTLDQAGGLVPGLTRLLAETGTAYAINNLGIVCGRGNLDLSTTNTEPVIWAGDVGLLLKLDRTTTIATPLDINDDGIIVGFAGLGSAVVWASPDAELILLEKFLKKSPFDSLSTAQAVNDSGEIVGAGWISADRFRPSFLAIPN